MFDGGWAEMAARVHGLLADLAAAVDGQTPGAEAAAALGEVLGAVRLGELAVCRVMERVDRSGAYAADGAASTTAFVRGLCQERSSWGSRRVRLGRALADRLPSTGKAWSAGDLGLEHAEVIARATVDIDDAQLAADVELFLAGQAPGLTPTELAALAEEIRAQAAPEESAQQTARKRARQSLHLSTPSMGCGGWTAGWTPKPD